MKSFGGKVLFLDRDDINTDEIIPAKYLTVSTKRDLAPHLLEDLKLEGFDSSRAIAGVKAVVTRSNFGCGSSREHAPWALEVNGISLVVASGFARIFRQNMFNCGLIAAQLPKSTIDELFTRFAASGAVVELDWGRKELTFTGESGRGELKAALELGRFDQALVEAGGWIDYANAKY